MSYYNTPENPLYEVLLSITGKKPPNYVKGIYSGNELGDKVTDLQEWCALNAKPQWSTGIGILEAAELIVDEAVSNDNIKPGPKKVKIQAPFNTDSPYMLIVNNDKVHISNRLAMFLGTFGIPITAGETMVQLPAFPYDTKFPYMSKKAKILLGLL